MKRECEKSELCLTHSSCHHRFFIEKDFYLQCIAYIVVVAPTLGPRKQLS